MRIGFQGLFLGLLWVPAVEAAAPRQIRFCHILLSGVQTVLLNPGDIAKVEFDSREGQLLANRRLRSLVIPPTDGSSHLTPVRSLPSSLSPWNGPGLRRLHFDSQIGGHAWISVEAMDPTEYTEVQMGVATPTYRGNRFGLEGQVFSVVDTDLSKYEPLDPEVGSITLVPVQVARLDSPGRKQITLRKGEFVELTFRVKQLTPGESMTPGSVRPGGLLEPSGFLDEVAVSDSSTEVEYWYRFRALDVGRVEVSTIISKAVSAATSSTTETSGYVFDIEIIP